MKKLFLSLIFTAVIAAVSAATTTYTFSGETAQQVYNSTATLSNGIVLTSSGTTATANGVWVEPTQNSGGSPAFTGRISLKDSQSAPKMANGGFTVAVGDVITIYFASSGDNSARTLGVSLDGTEVTTGTTANGPKNICASLNYTVPTAGTLTFYSKGSGMYVYKIEVTSNGTDIKDAISSDLLKKAGCMLENPTSLNVEIYTVAGVKVKSSSATSICTSELTPGFYVAKTAKGNLKFIK